MTEPELACCTECGAAFTRTTSKHTACSAKCRVRKHRRIAANKAVAPEVQERIQERTRLANAAAQEGALDIARDIIAQELRPVVRESLTDAVMQSISDLVELTPLMVAALKDDLVAQDPVFDSDFEPVLDENGVQRVKVDTTRRSRAVALVAKYTLGAPGLAPQPQVQTAPISVSFGELPRPDWEAPPPDRVCDECQLLLSPAAFDGSAPRCRECQSAIAVAAREVFDARA